MRSQRAEHSPPTRQVSAVLFAVFFLSGGLALTYQLAWVRGLTLELGATMPAVATVVSIFLGGLGVGAFFAGRLGDRLERPLTVYGLLELGIAGYALLSPLLLMGLLPALSRAAGAMGLDLALLPAFRIAVATALLLPPTVLMGATLPVLARFYVRRIGEGGRGAGFLYGINTLGAFVGAFVAGLSLLPTLGLYSTLLFAGGLNFVLGGWLLRLGRTWDRHARPPLPRDEAPAPAEEQDFAARSGRWILAAVTASALAALVCQVAWTRVLELVLGPSLYVATIVIGTFVGGLGLGAFAMAAAAKRRPYAARYHFFIVALLAAAGVALSAHLFGHLPELLRALYFRWELEENFQAVFFSQLALAGLVMLPPTVAMGALLPAALRLLVHDDGHTSRRAGLAYVWDTVGSIVGALATGFLLVPRLGVEASSLIAIGLLCAAAAASVAWMPRRRRVPLFAGAALALGGLVAATPGWNESLMTSGMYHYASWYRDLEEASLAEEVAARESLLYYRDGQTATVTVTRDHTISDEPKYLYISGKIEGSSGFDMATQRLLAHLPLVGHPDPGRVAVVGMGTGVTAGSVAAHDVDEIVIAEIEEAVVEAARLFAKENRGVHDAPGVSIEVTDGRLFQRLRPETFDVIVSQPSNPWFGGAVNLFTREYYELGARALRPGGVFAQWIQLYSLSPENVRVLLRTFMDAFPHVALFSTLAGSDLVLLGSLEPLSLDLRRIETLFGDPAIAEDLAASRVDVTSPAELLARFRMGSASLRAYAGEGERHTDARPIIGYRAPRDLYRQTGQENERELAERVDPLAQHVAGLPEDERALANLRADVRRACLEHAPTEELCERLTSD